MLILIIQERQGVASLQMNTTQKQFSLKRETPKNQFPVSNPSADHEN
jgi:hypothetical protein